MRVFDTRVVITADGMAVGPAQRLLDHLEHFRAPTYDGFLARVAASGLRGFGGAGFPVAKKWEAAIAAGGAGIVVANGAESEPASGKDAALLQLRPHLVLDGLSAAVRSTNSTRGVVWLHGGAVHSRTAVERAIMERRMAGTVDPPISIDEGPARYLTGESSAIVRALSGGPTLPSTRSAPAAVKGVDGLPTIVHNIETLVRVAGLATDQGQDGSRLMTIASSNSRTVVEAAPTDRLASLAAGTSAVGASCVLLGGYGGTWHAWNDVAAKPVSELAEIISAGIVFTLPRGACGVATTAQIVGYLAASSARQCGPCLFGLAELATVMERVAEGRAGRADTARLTKISDAVKGRGACHHPDGTVRMLGSAMRLFRDEFGAHRRGQYCPRRHDVPAPGSRVA